MSQSINGPANISINQFNASPNKEKNSVRKGLQKLT